MFARLFSAPDRSFLLLGPRGTGKSSWLQATYPDHPTFDLLDDDVLFDLSRDVHTLERRLPPRYQGTVVIDEVQKLPKLLDEVHRLIEQKRGLSFVLSASSARKLKRTGANLLAGRAAYERFHPLVAEELADEFNLKKALKQGLLPRGWNRDAPREFLKSYVMTYVNEEVKLEGLSRRIPEFNRFLEAASLSQGQPLNVSQVAADAGVERRTVSNYFEILEDILLAQRLPIFSRRAKRNLIKHNKFFFFDCGVFQTIRPRGPLDIDSEINGAALETLVLQHLRALNDLKRWEYQISYWRTRTHAEVDFVLYGPRGLVAIEVKSGSRVRETDFSGLKTFSEDYPEAECILLYTGSREYQHDGIAIRCVEPFLRGLSREL